MQITRITLSILLLLGVATTLLMAKNTKGPPLSMRRNPLRHSSVQKCEDELEIHLIPHSHDDVGWLKTFDEYYWGEKYKTQRAGVQYILDSVIRELHDDPNKKFVYCEIAFFKKWWIRQNENIKEMVRKVVASGQLEFVNGGFEMNDEATAYYEDMIDQMTIGHQFLLKEFGIKPTIGWQLDPFGHSSTQASLFSQMGFNAMFFSRMDYQDRKQRTADKALETIWIPQTSQGLERQIFAHLTHNIYEAPPTFCFDDLLCEDPPIVDDPTDSAYNVEERAKTFIAYFCKMCEGYRTNTLFHTMGSDFQYANAHKNFLNMDRLINYINSHPDLKASVKLSTPSAYVKKIYDKKVSLPNKTDDFFPYADVVDGYWTGYFTSRPALKGHIRDLGKFSQSFKKIVGLSMLKNPELVDLNKILDAVEKIEEAMAINQHHDAVAGTAKQAVTDDYVRILVEGKRAAMIATQDLINDLSGFKQEFSTCHWNQSAFQCNVTASTLAHGKSAFIRIFNPAHRRTEVTRIKVPHGKIGVYRLNGTIVENVDIICNAKHDCDLFFEDVFEQYAFSSLELRPIMKGKTTYQLKPVKRKANAGAETLQINVSDTLSLGIGDNSNELEVTKCEKGGINCTKTNLSLGFRYYVSYVKKNKDDDPQNSGAYIFRPNAETIDHSLPYTYLKSATIFQGKALVQINLDFGERANCSLRIYKSNSGYVEVESFINSIPVGNKEGKEVVLEIKSDINNKGAFYTDSNGLEMQRRRVNFRDSWELEVTQPIAGNYYPITSSIYIEDSERRLTVLNDRAQGGGSLANGQIEIMVHRRLLADDLRGVEEELNEKDADSLGLRARMIHYIVLGSKSGAEEAQRVLQNELDQPLLVLLSRQLNKELKSNSLGIGKVPEIPSRLVKTLFKPWNSTHLLYRVQNLDGTDIATLKHEWIQEERSLTGNQLMKEVSSEKLKWIDYQPSNSESIIRPLEIKTYMVDIKEKK